MTDFEVLGVQIHIMELLMYRRNSYMLFFISPWQAEHSFGVGL